MKNEERASLEDVVLSLHYTETELKQIMSKVHELYCTLSIATIDAQCHLHHALQALHNFNQQKERPH